MTNLQRLIEQARKQVHGSVRRIAQESGVSINSVYSAINGRNLHTPTLEAIQAGCHRLIGPPEAQDESPPEAVSVPLPPGPAACGEAPQLAAYLAREFDCAADLERAVLVIREKPDRARMKMTLDTRDAVCRLRFSVAAHLGMDALLHQGHFEVEYQRRCAHCNTHHPYTSEHYVSETGRKWGLNTHCKKYHRVHKKKEKMARDRPSASPPDDVQATAALPAAQPESEERDRQLRHIETCETIKNIAVMLWDRQERIEQHQEQVLSLASEIAVVRERLDQVLRQLGEPGIAVPGQTHEMSNSHEEPRERKGLLAGMFGL